VGAGSYFFIELASNIGYQAAYLTRESQTFIQLELQAVAWQARMGEMKMQPIAAFSGDDGLRYAPPVHAYLRFTLFISGTEQ
jgi:hypothetical protein